MREKSVGKSDFDTIYNKYVECVYRTALYYCGNHHVAEEITQTTFMKLYMNLGDVNPGAKLTWLKATAKHAAINYRRDLDREVLQEEVVCDSGTEIQLEDEFIEKLCRNEYQELAEVVFSELQRVNPRWYEAITTTYLLEKPQKEVAEKMGVKLEVLHSMLYRAKQWIKKNYEEQFDHLSDK